MIGSEAYKAITKIQSQIDEIKPIYNLLKSDIKNMSDSQIKSQVYKILNRLSKINLDSLNEYIKILQKYGIYETIKDQCQQITDDVDEIKNFIYSIDKESEEQTNDEEDEYTPKNKKLDYIKDKYRFLQKQVDSADIETVIRDAKRLENTVSRLNFEDLDEGDYEEMVEIKNSVSKMIRTFQGVQKSEKYGPYLESPLVELLSNNLAFVSDDKAKSRAALILNFIEDPERIEMFEPAIKRIIAKKMTSKEFKSFYQSVMSMIAGEKQFESFNTYKQRHEQLYFI